MPESITDLLLKRGFSIRKDNEAFEGRGKGGVKITILAKELAGHSADSFHDMASRKGWFDRDPKSHEPLKEPKPTAGPFGFI